MYPDIKASVASGTVAITSFAQASEEVRKAAPELAASATGTAAAVKGIAEDAHKVTSEFTKPKTFWQKLKAAVITAAKIGAAAL
jgi:hypothetical protein